MAMLYKTMYNFLIAVRRSDNSLVREPGCHTCIHSSRKKTVVDQAVSAMNKRDHEETFQIPPND